MATLVSAAGRRVVSQSNRASFPLAQAIKRRTSVNGSPKLGTIPRLGINQITSPLTSPLLSNANEFKPFVPPAPPSTGLGITEEPPYETPSQTELAPQREHEREFLSQTPSKPETIVLTRLFPSGANSNSPHLVDGPTPGAGLKLPFPSLSVRREGSSVLSDHPIMLETTDQFHALVVQVGKDSAYTGDMTQIALRTPRLKEGEFYIPLARILDISIDGWGLPISTPRLEWSIAFDPREVDTTKITARFADEELRVTIPRWTPRAARLM